jgi:hypothetical protein
MGGLPVTIDGYFQTWQYGVGHRQLWLRDHRGGTVILFIDVLRMELDSRFAGGLTLTPVRSHGEWGDGWPAPLLLLDLTAGSAGSGFVACATVSVTRTTPDGDEVVFRENASQSEHGVGGRRTEPGTTEFGMPLLRTFDPTKKRG